MQFPETHDDIDLDAEPRPIDAHAVRRRLAAVLIVVVVIMLLVFIPPLINVSRFQRRVDRNISTAIGRPVHFDKLSLTLLPMPGFTLENFVVDEDPAFGSEPILRSDEVRVTLRISSLWSRHVEFSKISLTEPTSVNLVHLSDGRWNIEPLLFQASHIESAPTSQRYASAAPRFPYIEATGARLNLKLDQEKTPFSLEDADFALWEDQPQRWNLRVEAHATRTDVAPGDTGTLRVEGTLGKTGVKAATLAETPIDLHGDLREAQLGGLTQFVSGSDAGLRGVVSASFALAGTVGQNTIKTSIGVEGARRADFVPPHELSMQIGCHATVSSTFHAFTGIECAWPPAESSNRSDVMVAANIPDVTEPRTASVRVTIPALPLGRLLDVLGVATPHPPAGFSGDGALAGSLTWGLPAGEESASAGPGKPGLPAPSVEAKPTWSGELDLSGASLTLDDGHIVPLQEVVLRATAPAAQPAHSHRPAAPVAPPPPDSFDLLPVTLDLGGREPVTLSGHLDDSGYALHLAGSVLPAQLLALGSAIPQLGDGLEDCLPKPAGDQPEPGQSAAPFHGNARGTPASASPADAPAAEERPVPVDLTATRQWGGLQIWCPVLAADSAKRPREN